VAGPTEAASWGNVLVQARALGVTGGSLPELRSFVRRSVHLTRYEPDEQEATWERAAEVVLASRAPAPHSNRVQN
jgi:rhamnulokinase